VQEHGLVGNHAEHDGAGRDRQDRPQHQPGALRAGPADGFPVAGRSAVAAVVVDDVVVIGIVM